ncbi:MAG: hypothetical protein WBZ29_01515 [Methanocella sp.]
MASSSGSRLLGILALCLVVLFVLLIFLLASANDNYFFNEFSDMIQDAFQVAPGSFAGWAVLLMVGGVALITILGTLSLVKYAIGHFIE